MNAATARSPTSGAASWACILDPGLACRACLAPSPRECPYLYLLADNVAAGDATPPCRGERTMPGHPTDHAGLEVLPFDECIRLLASVPVGRVGFFADGEIMVLPVNHVVDGHDPVFRTAFGTKLSAAGGQNLATFEADHYEAQTRTGWSVLVTGRAEIVEDKAEIERLSRSGLHPWATAVARPFWIRIRATSVTGRRTPGAWPLSSQ
jgi:uncharacterized protein